MTSDTCYGRAGGAGESHLLLSFHACCRVGYVGVACICITSFGGQPGLPRVFSPANKTGQSL